MCLPACLPACPSVSLLRYLFEALEWQHTPCRECPLKAFSAGPQSATGSTPRCFTASFDTNPRSSLAWIRVALAFSASSQQPLLVISHGRVSIQSEEEKEGSGRPAGAAGDAALHHAVHIDPPPATQYGLWSWERAPIARLSPEGNTWCTAANAVVCEQSLCVISFLVSAPHVQHNGSRLAANQNAHDSTPSLSPPIHHTVTTTAPSKSSLVKDLCWDSKGWSVILVRPRSCWCFAVVILHTCLLLCLPPTLSIAQRALRIVHCALCIACVCVWVLRVFFFPFAVACCLLAMPTTESNLAAGKQQRTTHPSALDHWAYDCRCSQHPVLVAA